MTSRHGKSSSKTRPGAVVDQADAAEKIGEKFEEYLNNKETPQGAIDAYWAASQKTRQQGYRQDPTQFQTAIPLLASGHSLTDSHPHVAFNISEPQESDGSVGMSGEAIRVDTMDCTGDELPRIASDITLTRDGDDASSFYMRPNGAKGQVIPASGYWNLEVKGMMPIGEEGRDETVIGRESGYYDIEQTMIDNPDAVSQNNSCITLVHNVHSPANVDAYERYNIPTTQVHMTVSRGPGQEYYLHNVRVACQYGGRRDVSAASCDPCRHDPRVRGRCSVAPVLCPERYGFHRTSRTATENYRGGGYAYSHNTPATHPAAGSQSFGETFGAWLDEYVGGLPEYVSKGMSVRVSMATDSKPLFDRCATYEDTGNPLMYGFGTATRALTAATLMRLLQKLPAFNWQTWKDDSRAVSGILLRDHCVGRALFDLYRRSCGAAGPTIFQLLTSTAGLPQNLSLHPKDVIEAVEGGLEKRKFKADEKEFADLLAAQDLIDVPGAQVHDSNIGWAIVGVIIRALSNVSDATIPITETARSLSMADSSFVTADKPSEEFGTSQRVMAPNGAMIGTLADMDALLRSLHSSSSSSMPGFKQTVMPVYRLSQSSTVSVTPGDWKVARVLSCPSGCEESKSDERRVCKYSTLSSSGWCSQGDAVHVTTVPDYALNISVALKRSTANQCSDICSAVVAEAVACYVSQCYRPQSGHAHPPCVPVDRIQACSLPPYYFIAHNYQRQERLSHCKAAAVDAKPAKSSCHSRMTLSFFLHTRCSQLYGGFQRCKEACEYLCNRVELAPLIDSCKIGDRLRVLAVGGVYSLQFFSTPTNLDRVPKCVRDACDQGDPQFIVLRFVEDQGSGTFRVLEGEKPSEHVHFFKTQTVSGRDVYAVQVYGVTYVNKEYVADIVSRFRATHKQIRSRLEDDQFYTAPVDVSTVQDVGASYVLPAVVGGLAAAGAGYLAGRAVSGTYDPYYNSYSNYYDPYTNSSNYYNPRWVPPLWGYGFYNRYRPWGSYTPYYGGLGRGRPYRRRWWRPQYRRFGPRRGPVGLRGPGGRRARRSGRRAGRRASRRRGRRSDIGTSMDTHDMLNAREETIVSEQLADSMATMTTV